MAARFDAIAPLAYAMSVNTLLRAACATAALVACSDGIGGQNDGGSDGATLDATDASSSIDAKTPADAGPKPVAVTLTGCPQAGYAGAFSIGGSPFALVVDTGSSELGVASAQCGTCNVTPLYTPGSSAIDQNATTSVSYVGGTGWSGEIYRDTFGVAATSISAPMNLIAIDSQSGGFFANQGCGFGTVPFAYEGIVGFGPDSLAKAGTDEPMGALASHGVPDIFSFALCGSGGELWLGGFDPSAASGPLGYTPLLNSNNYYAVRIDDLLVGSASLSLTAADIDDVVVDTDTTEFELPSTVYAKLRDAIAKTPYFQAHFGTSTWFDDGFCTPPLDASPPTQAAIDAALPPLALAIDDGANGSFQISLGATESYLQPIRKNGILYYCPEIEPRLGGGSTVLGSAAMRALFVVMDRAASRVGFATHTTCPAP